MRTPGGTLTSQFDQFDEHPVTEEAEAPARAVVDEVAAALAAQQLVQRLVTVTRAAHPEPQACTGFVELVGVLVDMEIDGMRCIVLETPQPRPTAVPLSPREMEIARMVAKGLPNKAIASVLQISTWTVSSHLRRVFTKLGVASRAEMVGRLLADGHIPVHIDQEQIIHD